MKKYGGMNDRGDAIMVTSVILFSIFLSAGSNYLLQYGEIEGKELDMEHVSDVEEAFLRIRTSMNSLLASQDTDTLILNRVPLGTPGNPYLTIARSSGVLTHTPQPSSFYIELVLESGGTETLLNSASGSMTYESSNYYFHDQTYHFTAGGVVLDQYSSEVVSSHPDLSIYRRDAGYSMDIFLYGMVGDYWKTSGIDSLPLKISMAGYSETEVDLAAGETLSIRVNGIGEEAWHDHLNSYFLEKGLSQGIDFLMNTPTDWDDPAQELEIDLPGIRSLYARLGDMEVRQ